MIGAATIPSVATKSPNKALPRLFRCRFLSNRKILTPAWKPRASPFPEISTPSFGLSVCKKGAKMRNSEINSLQLKTKLGGVFQTQSAEPRLAECSDFRRRSSAATLVGHGVTEISLQEHRACLHALP